MAIKVALNFCLILILNVAHANPPADDINVKALMHNLVLQYDKMGPYLSSDAAFSSAEGKATIKESLAELSRRVSAPPPTEQRGPGFRISYNLLADYVKKTEQSFSSGEMQLARMRLNGLGNMCASCHLQTPKASTFTTYEFAQKAVKNSSFKNAEFLFIVRRFDEALSSFDKLIRGFPKSAITSDELDLAAQRKVAIFARVYRDPTKAIASFKSDLANTNLPIQTRRNIEAWIAALEKWKSEKSDPSKMKTADLVSFVEKSLPQDQVRNIAPGHPELLNFLRLSGLLYERLFNEPQTTHAQQILYYLAQSERSLGSSYWYSISEIYLKECVVQYPKKPFSKKCFDAYAKGMQERYGGRPMPEGVRKSVEALRDYL
jgi:tetratricopeptide (TPR) repeat protein